MDYLVMIFKNEKYKRLTFVLFIPLLILGLYSKSIGYFIPNDYYFVTQCVVFYDDKKLDIYDPNCEIINSNYRDIDRYLFNDIVFGGFDFYTIVTINEKKYNTTLFSLKNNLNISEVNIKENIYNESGNQFVAYKNLEPISGYIYIKDSYVKKVFFNTIEQGKKLNIKVKFLNFIYHYLPILAPLFLYFFISLLFFLIYKIIKYIIFGKK